MSKKKNKIKEVETGKVVMLSLKGGGIIIATLIMQGVCMVDPDEHENGIFYRIRLGNKWMDVYADELESIRNYDEVINDGRR